MTKTERIFIKMTACFIRGQEYKDDSMVLEEHWEKLLSMSAFHHLLPAVYDVAAGTDSFLSSMPAVAGMWKRETVMAVARQVQFTKEFLRLYEEMLREGIRPLVVKGIILRELYKKPDYRISADEDLVVRREDFWKLDQFLVNLGYERKETEEELRLSFSYLHEIAYVNQGTGLKLEIHLSLFDEQSKAYGSWNRLFTGIHVNAVSTLAGNQVLYTLDETQHFLYLLCHSGKHFVHSGFGIRQVCDLILYAEGYGSRIRWDEVIKEAKKLKLYRFLLHLFDIGVRYLSFDWRKAEIPDRMAKEFLYGNLDSKDLLKDILAGGIYGYSSGNRMHSANITLTAMSRESVLIKGLGASLFPPISYMKKRYDYVKRYPFLLPVSWVHRFLQFVKEGGNHRQVVETGQQRVKLLKKYGLL